MADNTEMEAQSTSSTGMDFLVNSDVAAEELSQSGLETISETKQIETESRESETDEMIFPSKVKKNRKCVVLDSDDDDLMQEPEIKLSENLYETNTIAHSDETMFKNESHTNDSNQSDEESVKRNTKRSRIKPVWNSDPYNEDSSDYEMDNKSPSYSKDKLNDKTASNLPAKSLKKKLIKKHLSSESDDSNSSASENGNKETSKMKLAWNSGGDSDGSCEGDDSIKEKNNSSVSPKARKLKKKPIEEIQKIHSESQRMVRESTVCLPYHKPKQRSLLEFLNRKRVNNEDCAKPRPRDVGPVVQVLEDRVKEIEEFFKSESEESENETEKLNAISLHDQELLPPNQELSVVDSNPSLTNIDNVPYVAEKILLESEKPQSPTTSHSVENISIPDSLEEIETTNNSAAAPQDISDSNNTFDKATNEIKSSSDLISDGSNDSWLDHSSILSHKEKVENIKRLSIAKMNKPTLQGRPGQLLDFDLENASTPDQKDKVNNLIERFVQQVTNTKKSPKKDVQISIVHKVMNADGQLELKRDVLNVPVENASSECASAGRRQLLRDSLRQSISAKRAVDRMKRMENQQIENEDFQSDGKLDSEPEEEILSDEPETDLDEDEDEEDNGYERKEKKEKKKNIFVDEEAEDSDENNSEDDDEDDVHDEDSVKSTIHHSAGQSEINKNDSQLDDIVSASRSDLKLSLKSSGCFSSFEGLTPNLNESDSSDDLIPKLRDTQNNDASNVEELIGLCSGKFPDSTPGGDTQKSHLNEMVDDDEFEEDFKPFSRIIPMVDDDDDSNSSQQSHTKLQIEENDGRDESESAPMLLDDEDNKSKPNRKKRAIICLSDDDDENGDEGGSIVDDEEMHEEEREFRGLTDFFEDEAELSGSEVGSGDEREDEVDDWEEEEGDKEDIDENEVREQIGRAHMKTLLDQDQRDVRLFQELFLEDGDLHSDGGGRQRQFRWKNVDSEGTEDNRPKTQEEEAEEGTEEQDDLTWRKMRSEREKWLQQQKSQQEVKKDVPLVMKRNGKMVKVNTKPSSNAVEKADSSVAAVVDLKQYTSPKKNIAATVRRGSFLRRSEKDLSALASLTKSVLPVQAPRTGSNFVFASITPERPPVEERRKVKQEASNFGSSDQNPAPAKKAKVSLSAKSIFSYF